MPKKGTKKGSSKKEKEEEEFELEKEEEPKETGKKERKKRKRKATSAFKEELTALFERPFIQRVRSWGALTMLMIAVCAQSRVEQDGGVLR